MQAPTFQTKNQTFSWLLETFVVPSDTDDYQVQQKQILISLYFAIGEENWNHKYDFIYHQICTNERGKDQKQDY